MPREQESQDELRRAKELSDLLDSTWDEIGEQVDAGNDVAFLEDERLVAKIRDTINSSTISYRWVLPTQIGAKVVDHSLDARCCQVQRGGLGAYDARSICKKAVVPFFMPKSNVLGGKDDPYVNNPLRVPEITAAHRDQRSNKSGWDKLCEILATVQAADDPEFTQAVFRQTLLEIRQRLETIRITYPTPLRLPIEATIDLIREFISERSGGVRVQAVGSALFETLGDKYHFNVLISAPTAADTPSGRIADVECQYEPNETFIAIEIKDRSLRITEARNTVANAREREVKEIIFIAQNGVSVDDQNEMDKLVKAEYSKGQNIYVCDDIMRFAESLLIILGEEGRKAFLDNVACYLDEHADYSDRRTFSELLRKT